MYRIILRHIKVVLSLYFYQIIIFFNVFAESNYNIIEKLICTRKHKSFSYIWVQEVNASIKNFKMYETFQT